MRRLIALLGILLLQVPLFAQSPKFERTEDVIYGRKFGTCLTLDVLAPKEKPNGLGVIFCVSGGWYSSKESVNPGLYAEFINRGYVVFAVMHGSQPKYSIPEVLGDMHRAVRFIKSKAKDYKVDPDKLGITGISAGGHLSLMQGFAPLEADSKSKDPVERESSSVAAVGAFVAPTDFLNWGKEGVEALGNGPLKAFKAPFDFPKFNPETNSMDVETDPKKRTEIGISISPYFRATSKSPPILLLYGEKDRLVPLQQAERLVEKLKSEKITHELFVKEGADHVWVGMEKDMAKVADWIEKHTAKK